MARRSKKISLVRFGPISRTRRAAGAVWVACEALFAAVQAGWIQVTSMRTIKLLGNMDAGAPRAFVCHLGFSTLLVAVLNVPLLTMPRQLARLVTNDEKVVRWLQSMVIVLVHAASE